MRNVIVLCIFVLMAIGGVNAAGEASLTIELSGLAEAEGDVYISVYDNPDDWLGEATTARLAVVINDARVDDLVVAKLELPPGDYAISIYYDVNDNGDLDTNFIGIPKEPVALSNNARMKFGPPKYKDAVFSLTSEGLTQRIEMKAI